LTTGGSGVSTTITVEYDSVRLAGVLSVSGSPNSSIWDRVRARAVSEADGRLVGADQVALPWYAVLELLLDYGSRAQQQLFGFRFHFVGEASLRAAQFAQEVKNARTIRADLTLAVSEDVTSLVSSRCHMVRISPYPVRGRRR
jgi:hypothetical protein